MAEIILERTGMTGSEAFHTIHNYIDTDEMILRKGTIAAHNGEKVLIPINMRDGSVLAIGKGNPEWNYSAPHGAGRIMSRTKAKDSLSMDEYRETMKGIYTTSINENTLDEAPMAYKSLEDIIDVIKECMTQIHLYLNGVLHQSFIRAVKHLRNSRNFARTFIPERKVYIIIGIWQTITTKHICRAMRLKSRNTFM